MSAQDWAGFILTVLSIITVVGIGARWVLKKYVVDIVSEFVLDIVSELKPNSGSSMKDQVTRLETQSTKIETKVDMLFEMFKEHVKSNKD